MATMTKILVLVMILVGSANGKHKPVPEYIHCGKEICLNDVPCNEEESKCDCPPGETGNARVQCANPNNYCICTIQGDPHFCDFSGQTYSLPIPCAHRIANVNTPAGTNCRVSIAGRAWYSHPDGSNGASFEGLIHIEVVFNGHKLLVKFERNKSPEVLLDSTLVTSTSPILLYYDITISELDMGGFYTVKINQCQIELKYGPHSSTFSLLAPVKTTNDEGMCGDCSEKNSTHPSGELILQRILNNLMSSSPVDGSNINIYETCDTLTQTVNDCPLAKRAEARQYCGHMLIQRTVRKCLNVKLNGNLNLLSEFNDCYRDVCSSSLCGNGAPEDYYGGCPPENLVDPCS